MGRKYLSSFAVRIKRRNGNRHAQDYNNNKHPEVYLPLPPSLIDVINSVLEEKLSFRFFVYSVVAESVFGTLSFTATPNSSHETNL